MFNFLAVFQREEAVKANELERDVNGLIQRDTQKKKFKDRSLIIEHYSLLLQSGKINVARFLKTMTNMDNKIAFEEHEYPVLDLTQIDFQTEADCDKVRSLLKRTESIDSAPLVMNSDISPQIEIVVPEPLNTPILTRGKARKAALSKSKESTSKITRKRKADEPADGTRTNKRMANLTSKRTGPITRGRMAEESIEEAEGNSVIDLATELSSSGTELSRLHDKFQTILKQSASARLKTSSACIMDCGRPRATLLLPCKHQPTCNQCFVLYKVYVQNNGRTTFCPICKTDVLSHIAVTD